MKKKLFCIFLCLMLVTALAAPAAFADNVFAEAGKDTVSTGLGDIWQAVFRLVEAVLLFGLTYLVNVVRRLYEKYCTDQKRKDIVETCVRFGEQIFKDIHGAEKFSKVREECVSALNGAGIPYTEIELDRLIEAAVNTMNGGKHKGA